MLLYNGEFYIKRDPTYSDLIFEHNFYAMK